MWRFNTSKFALDDIVKSGILFLRIRNFEKSGVILMPIMLQIRSNGQITLPASIRRQANLQEGDALEVTVDENGTLHLVPQVLIERSQCYFWTERWQTGERETEEDLRAGRYKDFDDIESLLEELKSDEG
jgi:antitoxin PrlF